MKKCFYSSVIGVSLFLLGSMTAFAEESTVSSGEEQTKTIVLDNSLSIEKKEDGRVAPVENAESLSESQLDQVLEQMEMTQEQIEALPLEAKIEFVSEGGLAVSVSANVKEYYNSLNGERILVTDENREEVELIKTLDSIKANGFSIGDNLFSTLKMGSVKDGSFYGTSSITYVGSNSSTWTYKYFNSFSFNKRLNYKYTDTFAIAWQPHTTSIGTSASAIAYSDMDLFTKPLTVTTSHGGTTGGRIAKIKHAHGDVSDKSTTGQLTETVTIPKNNSGETGKWVVRYAHPWSLLSPSISIGPLTIDFSAFWGDEWEWENTFTINS